MASRAFSYPPQAPAGFPQVPFNGPPPKPAHIRVNPQDWQNGSWSMNPAFNSSQWSLSSTQSWAPSQAWHQQRQQEWQVQQQQMAAAAAYNPYKRVPRPPSAEYLASRLSDNPLGLTNMVPREELFGPSQDGLAAPTPWVWNPRRLNPDEDDAGPSTSSTQGPEEPAATASIPPHSAPPHGVPPSMYARQSQPREMSDPTPQSRPTTATPIRHSSEPPAERRSSADSLPALDRPLERPRSHQRHYQAENFTAARELQPTFSMNIVRTPDHYRTRSSSAGPSPPPQPIYGPPAPRRSMDSADILASRMERLNTGTNGLSRHASLPAPLSAAHNSSSSSISGVSNFVEEPSSLLSPLVIPATSKQVARPLGPSSSLSAIPEASDSDSTRRSPHRKSNRRSRHTSPAAPGSRQSLSQPSIFGANISPPRPGEWTSPNTSPPHGNHQASHLTPPHLQAPPMQPQPPIQPQPPPNNGPNITPPRVYPNTVFTPPHPAPGPSPGSGPLLTPSRSNPLPDPPKEPARNPEFRLPVQRSPPSHYRVAVRKGMWNRRGDHLTVDGFVVYAPADRAYPPELADYPAETMGYRDHFGAEIPYLQARPELPESLPVHGRPPLQPYEKFVVYEYLQ